MGTLSKQRNGSKTLLAAGGLIGAVLASSCCIAPLVLITLGVSGAWLSHLTALAPYQGYFMVATVGFLGLGYWHVYAGRASTCAERAACTKPRSILISKIMLWVASALLALAFGINVVSPYFL